MSATVKELSKSDNICQSYVQIKGPIFLTHSVLSVPCCVIAMGQTTHRCCTDFQSDHKNVLSQIMPMSHYPETDTSKPVPVSCRCVMQFDTNYFWYRNLVRFRALLYSMKETSVGVLVLVSGQCDMGLIPETSNCSTVVYIDSDGEACNQKVKAQG